MPKCGIVLNKAVNCLWKQQDFVELLPFLLTLRELHAQQAPASVAMVDSEYIPLVVDSIDVTSAVAFRIAHERHAIAKALVEQHYSYLYIYMFV